jgi:predicted O-methyltransferase YrrM
VSRTIYLLFVAFLSGAGVMTIEMGTARLAAPHLGSALPVWAAIISWILVCASAGYAIGGKLSGDRRAAMFPSALLVFSSLFVAFLPVAGPPCLRAVSGLLFGGSVALAAGAGLLMAVLLGAPVFFLGAAGPVITQLLTTARENSGKAAGMVQACSTAGSILGTLIPAFWSIQAVGTKYTFAGFGVILLAAGLPGAIKMRPARMLALPAAVLLPFLFIYIPGVPPRADGSIIHYEETPYHSAYVVKRDSGILELKVDDGTTDQSASGPGGPVMTGSWSYLAMAALLRGSEDPPRRALVIGLAAGTVASQLSRCFPGMEIDGVELDGDLVEIGRRYFGLPTSVAAFEVDGRLFLAGSRSTYDLVILDAFRSAYVPFHMLTIEFFKILKTHLRRDGVAALNLLSCGGERSLVDATGATLGRVFTDVRSASIPAGINTILYASMSPMKKTAACSGGCEDPLETFALAHAKEVQKFHPGAGSGEMLLTDDHAPVERLTHRVLFKALTRCSAGP